MIASTTRLSINEFGLVKENGKVAFQGVLSEDPGEYLAFKHHYRADFGKFKKKGEYRLTVGNVQSSPFEIGKKLYRSLPDSLLQFFEVQRCGDTEPLLHAPCHLADAATVRSSKGKSSGVDLTGGWHDAGDYVKFTLTTSYAVYLLLLSYELFPDYFEDQLDESFHLGGLPAPLVEAKVGLDWLMKCHPSSERLISQVQDTSDHEAGWRLPEADPLAGQRDALEYPSKATAGSAAAAFALGSQVFKRMKARKYSEHCLQHAIQIFDRILSNGYPDSDCRGDPHYCDNDPRDNIALAAIELYRATKEERYLHRAKGLIDTLGAGGWISWGDVQGIAAFRTVKYHKDALGYLKVALEEYQTNGAKNPYDYPFEVYPWGSLNLQTGVGMIALLYEAAGGKDKFRELADRQRDAVLGMNSFGVSYMANVGDNSVRNFHHQISFLKGVVLPGAVAEGPISMSEFKSSGIVLDSTDRFAVFQSDQAVFHDDRMDFLCNEPTIAGNAQAFFLMTWYAANGNFRKR